MPSWLTTGSLPVILAIIAGLVIIYIWVNFRLKRLQRDLHTLGRSFYEKEQVILDDLKAGKITQGEYRKAHSSLVRKMREESRKITDGPPV